MGRGDRLVNAWMHGAFWTITGIVLSLTPVAEAHPRAPGRGPQRASGTDETETDQQGNGHVGSTRASSRTAAQPGPRLCRPRDGALGR